MNKQKQIGKQLRKQASKPDVDIKSRSDTNSKSPTISKQEKLTTHQIYLDSILKNLPDLVYRLNPAGEINYVNQHIHRYGYDSSELIGQNIINLVHPDDREQAFYHVRERRTGQRKTSAFRLRLLSKAQQQRLASGQKVNGRGNHHFLLEAEGIYNDTEPAKPEFIGTQAIAREITQTVSLSEKMDRLSAAFDQIHLAVLVLDKSGVVFYANRPALGLLNHPADEVVGTHCSNLIDSLHVGKLFHELDQIINHGEKRKNFRWGEYTVSIEPLSLANGQVHSYTVMLEPQSGLNRIPGNLQQAQKMEAVGLLAGGIAHDFNNLLTVINGYADLILAQMPEEDPSYPFIEQILSGGQKARDLIRQLLEFSRREIIDPVVLQMNTIIIHTKSMLRRLIGADIELITKLARKLSLIKADPGQVEQILLNLIINARDAVNAVSDNNFQKQIIVETFETELDEYFVQSHPGSSPGRHVVLAVSDTGCGMPKSRLDHIFEPFYTTKEEGTGLGLATVYGIVKQNRGCVYVYSEIDKGTTFKIYWPVSVEPETIKPKEKEIPEQATGHECILVVEDDNNVRAFTCAALELAGYKVYDAKDGQDALELIKRRSVDFDLIIADAILPKMNGTQLVKKAKAILPEVSVLYTSGYTDHYIVDKCELIEGVNFLQKPYTGKSLATKVREVFERS